MNTLISVDHITSPAGRPAKYTHYIHAGLIRLYGEGDFMCAPRHDSFGIEFVQSIARQLAEGKREGTIGSQRWEIFQPG